MSYTTLADVKKHLLHGGCAAVQITEEPVVFTATQDVELAHHNLAEDSESLRWTSTPNVIHEGPLSISESDWNALANARVNRDSLVVSLTESLDSVYMEERDYQIDYAAGRIRRVAGSSIPAFQPLHIYYTCFQQFTRGTDYDIDYAQGLIHRLASGAIPDGARVLMDYQVLAGNITDELILQAITETEDLIVRSLAVEYNQSSTDQGLQTGATQLVLSVIARDMALDMLTNHPATDAASRAKEWQNLATQYDTRAWAILRPFLDPFAVHSPEKAPYA